MCQSTITILSKITCWRLANVQRYVFIRSLMRQGVRERLSKWTNHRPPKQVHFKGRRIMCATPIRCVKLSCERKLYFTSSLPYLLTTVCYYERTFQRTVCSRTGWQMSFEESRSYQAANWWLAADSSFQRRDRHEAQIKFPTCLRNPTLKFNTNYNRTTGILQFAWTRTLLLFSSTLQVFRETLRYLDGVIVWPSILAASYFVINLGGRRIFLRRRDHCVRIVSIWCAISSFGFLAHVGLSYCETVCVKVNRIQGF